MRRKEELVAAIARGARRDAIANSADRDVSLRDDVVVARPSGRAAR